MARTIVGVICIPKTENKNEDAYDFNETTFVVADGATDKSGEYYDGQTGGQILSKEVVHYCMNYTGSLDKLVSNLTEYIDELYTKKFPKSKKSGYYRFGSTLLYGKIDEDAGVFNIIQVGDGGFRINAENTFLNSKIVDRITANTRSDYIKHTKDFQHARSFILPLLKNQYQYQNNENHPLGYGMIDGTPVPPRFIKSHQFKLSELDSIELFTDGYFDQLPDKALTEAREEMYAECNENDPYKYMIRKGTKDNDDRTVMVIKFL